MLIARGLIGGAVQVALFGALLLIPAGLVPGGTWTWDRALMFLGAYGATMVVSVVTLGLAAPASLEARLQRPTSKDQPTADRWVTAILILAFFVWFVFMPIDVFYLKLFPAPGPTVSAFGGALAFAGYALVMATIYQNAFAKPIVEDQTAQGQTLVDTGLYSLVRHPMYTGMVPFFAGIALWLESFAGLVAVSTLVLILIARITVEEQTLNVTLPGYPEYTQRVRYRLVPFVW